MDNSILYGLRNPSMTEDIGMSLIERQYQTQITPLGYTPANVTNKSAYFNQPYADTFQTKREKEHSTLKKILIGLGLVAVGVFAYKKGLQGIKKAYNYIEQNASDIFSKSKNAITNLYTKIKTKVSP